MIPLVLTLMLGACLFSVGPLLAGRVARWAYERLTRPRRRDAS